jgi:hypothetical protein
MNFTVPVTVATVIQKGPVEVRVIGNGEAYSTVVVNLNWMDNCSASISRKVRMCKKRSPLTMILALTTLPFGRRKPIWRETWPEKECTGSGRPRPKAV